MRVPDVLIISAVAVLMSAPAHGQNRAFVTLTGGATFNAATAPLVQIDAGADIVPAVQVIAEFIYMRDVLPTNVRGRIGDTARSYENFSRIVLGQTVTVNEDAKAPTLSGAVGVRLVPWPARFRPFLQVDMGFARVDPRISFLAGGQDVSNAVGPPSSGAETKPAVGLGGGADFEIGRHLTAEARYKFTRVFAEQAFGLYGVGGFNVNALAFGIGYRF